MAKPGPKPKTRGQATLDKAASLGYAPMQNPTPPAGASVVEGPSAAGFFTFETEGQTLQGTLTGTRTVPNNRGEDVERYELVPEGAGDAVILPDHWDLNERIKTALETNAMPVRLWIAYRGRRPANTPAGFVVVYNVAVLGPGKAKGKDSGETAVPF